LPAFAGQCFPATARLRSSREYSRLWHQGERCQTKNFTVIAAKPSASSSQTWPRMGITVSRKVGNAVCRNRIKRWLREFFRCNHVHFGRIVDISVIAKPGAAKLTHTVFDQELQEVLRRLHLYVDV